jgi:hypothetical protein
MYDKEEISGFEFYHWSEHKYFQISLPELAPRAGFMTPRA